MSNQIGFRQLYNNSGNSDLYYINHGNSYSNPHQNIIEKIVKNIVTTFFTIQHSYLDLGCGGGQVSIALESIGCKNVVGLDPYTTSLYKKNCPFPILAHSFQDVAYNKIQLDNCDVVIASFSLHLCRQHDLKLLCINLALVCKWLVIISPHKNPILTDDCKFTLFKSFKSERIHVRIYKSLFKNSFK
jgi:SAM-dependent methyltransferase